VCGKKSTHSIRHIKLCTEHYIEALEHSAHIVSLVTGGDHPIKVEMPPVAARIRKTTDNMRMAGTSENRELKFVK
jgi:hypothetical protein